MTPQAARRLERKMQEPANFGMAKSFVMMGKQAGFDMESPEGMQAWVQAWVQAYNATVAPQLAASSLHPEPLARKKSLGATKRNMIVQRCKKKHTKPE